MQPLELVRSGQALLPQRLHRPDNPNRYRDATTHGQPEQNEDREHDS
jgi:hypothetical protein